MRLSNFARARKRTTTSFVGSDVGGQVLPRLVDLHAHTTASDGTLSPAELVQLASAKRLAALAVTDHDTVDGVAPAQAAAQALGVEVIPGIELSAHSVAGEMHVLGYFLDIASATLQARLEALRRERAQRVPRIVERLDALGVPLTVEDVLAQSKGGALGRPHVAAALVRSGAVKTIAEAFEGYLAEGRPAYVPKPRLPPEDAVRIIREAGGVAVVAHPFTLASERRAQAIREMARAGAQGVEVDYPRHDPKLREELRELARELDLVATGGSDFHGAMKPDIHLGTGGGDLRLPYDLVDALRTRRP